MKFKNIFLLILIGLVTSLGIHVKGQALLSTLDTPVDSVIESAMLALVSDNSGLKIPTIELVYDEGEVTAPSIPVTPADGLIIYHDGRNNITRGMWYYDAEISKWIIYTNFNTEESELDINDFGELYESNDLGDGTAYNIEDTHHKPWSSASTGLKGTVFQFLDSEPVLTEIGSDTADQYQITGPDAIYSVVISATIAATAPATTLTGSVFVNDVKVDHLFFRHTFQNKDKPTSLNTSGNLEIHTNDKIDIRFISSTKNKGIEIENMNIRLAKITDL